MERLRQKLLDLTKTYSYIIDNDTQNKKAKGTKNKYNKTGLSLMIVKKSFLSSKTTSKLQQRFKIEKQNVNTEEVNKIGLSSNDLKRLQTFDKAKLYPMLQMLENM